ncbi:MAG TPA: hypothetical protein VHR66_24350, partial [Gemmataceae bacterium]|nr:hypothetical protein [Gemmataceae bacterium]
MRHTIDVWRPTFSAGQITGYTLTFQNVPSFVQPLSAAEQLFYMQRGIEASHTIYTTQVQDYQREDVAVFTDSTGKEHQFHVNGAQQNLFISYYCQLDCLEWPEEAKKR